MPRAHAPGRVGARRRSARLRFAHTHGCSTEAPGLAGLAAHPAEYALLRVEQAPIVLASWYILRDVDADGVLLERWRAGDASAGEELFDRYFDRLFRFFWNKVNDGAEDLVQETLMACVRGKERIEDTPFAAYVFRTARNRLVEHWRRRRRGQEVVSSSTSAAEQAVFGSDALVKQEEERVLLYALRQLPLDHQILLELFYWEGLPGPQLAVILEVPEGTVRSRLRKAKALLHDRILAVAASDSARHSTVTRLDDWAARVRAYASPDPD